MRLLVLSDGDFFWSHQAEDKDIHENDLATQLGFGKGVTIMHRKHVPNSRGIVMIELGA